MATPSLLIIPDRYKAAKLYSQLPESGAGDFVVTRGTTATRVNASGLIESVASGVPRLDYTGGGCPSLLVEPAATNLMLRSEELDDAYWIKTGAGAGAAPVVTANNSISPDGTLNADQVYFDAVGLTAADRSGLIRDFAFTSGQVYTISAFVKSATGANQILQFRVAGEQVGGELIATSDWQRFSVTHTATTTGTDNFGIQLRGTNTANQSDLIIYGMQLELGSVATSYIPTVASTVTRNADVISRSSASGLIGQTEGTIYLEMDLRDIPVNSEMFELSDGTSSNRIRIRRLSSVTIGFARIKSGETNIQINSIISSSGKFKMAFAYSPNANGYEVFINGVSTAVLATASATFTNELNQINIGSNAGGTSQINDRISAAAVYTSRLSNSELATLTTL